MKKLLFFLLLPVYSFAQPCADEDTVRSNAVTLITANTARVNGTTTHFSGTVISMQLRYVRVGQTDTATASAVGTSALRNLTGLQAGTQYVYYYKSICGSGTLSQAIGPYTFTTLTSTVVYAAERSTVFPYVKVDTGFTIPRLDTGSLYRAADIGGNIRFRPADSLPYYYNGEIWKLLAVDSAGILPALNLKVDSVTVAGDSLFYWVNGVSYGYILGTLASNWHTTGNASTSPGTNFIGTTDAQALWINTNGYNRLIVPAAGIASSTASTDSVLVTKTDGVTLGKIAKSALHPTWQQTLTAGSTLTTDNTVAGGGFDFIFDDLNKFYVTNTGASTFDLNDSFYVKSQLLTHGSELYIKYDSIKLKPFSGNFVIDTLTSAPGTKSLRYNPTSGLVSYTDTSTASGSGTVTSVAKGYGILADGTITTTGTITADTSILVNKTGSQTLTNKTLTSPVINVTSDATGDMYYRNASGLFTRLPIGTAGQHLVGGTIPAWKDTAAGGGGGMAIGGAITSATAGSVLFAGTGGTLQQKNSDLFYDSANARLGIGKSNPAANLDIQGSGNVLIGLKTTTPISISAVNLSNDSNKLGQIFKTGTSYTPYKNVFQNDFGIYTETGNMSFLNDVGNINFATGGSSTAQLTLSSTGNLTLTGGLTAGTINTVTGSTIASGNLNLISTSNLTKGKILFGTNSAYDQVNDRLGVGVNSPNSKLHIGSIAGANGGINLDLLANNSLAIASYSSIDFNVPTTGITGQFLSTASNYSNAGLNLAANSIGLLGYATSGQLGMFAGGGSGFFTVNTGGLTSAEERLRITSVGNVGIGTTTPAALLDLTSTTKGLLIPRMTTTQRNAISSPATALQIFSTTDSTNYLYRGTTSGWQATLTGIRGSGTLDFGSIAHHSEEVLTISVTGAAEGDVVSLGIPNASNLTNVIFTAWVSATDTVSVKCSNLDQSATQDPASGTFKVTILKF